MDNISVSNLQLYCQGGTTLEWDNLPEFFRGRVGDTKSLDELLVDRISIP